jgi:hypothetical protein
MSHARRSMSTAPRVARMGTTRAPGAPPDTRAFVFGWGTTSAPSGLARTLMVPVPWPG